MREQHEERLVGEQDLGDAAFHQPADEHAEQIEGELADAAARDRAGVERRARDVGRDANGRQPRV